MTSKLKPMRWLLLALLVVPVAGCAGGGYDLSPQAPPGFELTGDWILEPIEAEPHPASGEGQAPPDGDGQVAERRGGNTRSGGDAMTSAMSMGPRQIPVLGARSFVIEQSRDSMGIDYPGRPVRDVSWGRREWRGNTIDAGWEEGVLIIRTLSDHYRLTERYVLSGDGQRLTLILDFDPKRGEDINARRVFVRHDIPGRAET